MNVLQKLIAMLSFFILLHVLAITTHAKNGETYEVTAHSLHVRNTPSLNGEILGILEKGEILTVYEERTDWLQIDFQGIKAWVASNYLSLIDPIEEEIFFPNKKLINYTIVLDPGHGGKDPGAIGHNGVLEKDIILSTTRKIAEHLRSTGANVILTRTDDYFVSLDERIEVSNINEADAFLSIHYNSFSMQSVGGFNTYYYSNETDLGLAQAIHTSLAGEIKLRNRGIIRDDYRVLRKNNSPAVLIELGFITNSNDLVVIQTEDYQNRVAKAITTGIKEYLSD
ncbi:N-acetylmuramoyl-L-alanine amidase [Ornithinibacillus salinisoli]|uniref:N-acetylmuramoyl-L-alanine amidase n=1 Tax=Ornithinibacillus salinisoli TaxID=1848459 RepID=A0ABW4VVV3_9BACI